jgi:hypothetical protein
MGFRPVWETKTGSGTGDAGFGAQMGDGDGFCDHDLNLF